MVHGNVGDRVNKLDGILNTEKHHQILIRYVIPCGKNLTNTGFMFQHHSDTKRTTEHYRSWIGLPRAQNLLQTT